jgi:hypothetical protein
VSTELEARVKALEAEIILLNQKTMFLLMTCIKHGKEMSAVADILEELVVDVPAHKDDMMASLADDIAKAASRTSPLN